MSFTLHLLRGWRGPQGVRRQAEEDSGTEPAPEDRDERNTPQKTSHTHTHTKCLAEEKPPEGQSPFWILKDSGLEREEG